MQLSYHFQNIVIAFFWTISHDIYLISTHTFYKECALCAARGQGFFCLLCGTEFALIKDRVYHEGLDHTLLEGQIPLRSTCPWVKVMTVEGMVFDLEIRTEVMREAGHQFLNLVRVTSVTWL